MNAAYVECTLTSSVPKYTTRIMFNIYRGCLSCRNASADHAGDVGVIRSRGSNAVLIAVVAYRIA